jgi:hypothetical protein
MYCKLQALYVIAKTEKFEQSKKWSNFTFWYPFFVSEQEKQ